MSVIVMFSLFPQTKYKNKNSCNKIVVNGRLLDNIHLKKIPG